MATYFLDTSALVKRYIEESGTDWIRRITHLEADSEIYLVRLTAAEIVSAFFRKVRLGEMGQQEALNATESFKSDLVEQFHVIEVSEELTDLAITLIQRHPLRGYDSVQLAAVLELQQSRIAIGASPLIFVSADVGLNRAAQSEGLSVANPNEGLYSQSI